MTRSLARGERTNDVKPIRDMIIEIYIYKLKVKSNAAQDQCVIVYLIIQYICVLFVHQELGTVKSMFFCLFLEN